jgi:surface antigen
MIRQLPMPVLELIGPLLLGHISKPYGTPKLFVATGRLAALGVLMVALSGCMGEGFSVAGVSTADRKLTTSAVQSNYKAPADAVSDEATVRNAVSSADLSRPGSLALPWANTSTGSNGVVTAITEENNGSYVCRNFVTTRHSYRGISNFAGKACLVGSGEWQVISFKEIG